MTRKRHHDALSFEEALLYSQYPALRTLYPVHDRALARRRPTPNDKRPRRGGGRRGG